MAAGDVKTKIEIGESIYNVAVGIPADDSKPYLFKVANENEMIIGLALSTEKSGSENIETKNVFLSVSPPKSILPDMIKYLSVNFYNGKYTSSENPLLLWNSSRDKTNDELEKVDNLLDG